MQSSATGRRRIGIVAALEREVAPLVSGWPFRIAEHNGRAFKFFESERAVVICAGIGRLAALRGAKAMVDEYRIMLLISCGLCGGLSSTLTAGNVLEIGRVIDVTAAKSYPTVSGSVTLLTVDRILRAEEKRRLAEKYSAQACDMEAAAVAEVAAASRLPFMAIKAISDELDFPMPRVDRFISADGSFATARFGLYAALRPWLWPRLSQLARNSALAAKNLCQHLRGLIERQESAPPAFETRSLT